MEKHNFSYDEYSDSLIVSNRQENEIVKENFEVGDLIFSLTGRGKIVSIEIREISSFLESCNVNSDILNKLEEVELEIKPRKDSIFILLRFDFQEGNVTASKNIPLIMPLLNR